jgi:hypothetical protein
VSEGFESPTAGTNNLRDGMRLVVYTALRQGSTAGYVWPGLENGSARAVGRRVRAEAAWVCGLGLRRVRTIAARLS